MEPSEALVESIGGKILSNMDERGMEKVIQRTRGVGERHKKNLMATHYRESPQGFYC